LLTVPDSNETNLHPRLLYRFLLFVVCSSDRSGSLRPIDDTDIVTVEVSGFFALAAYHLGTDFATDNCDAIVEVPEMLRIIE
jgi:hypothetical protein